MEVEYKSHLQNLSKIILLIILLSGCQDDNQLKIILTKESYSEYKIMSNTEKKEFEQSVWYFYMYQEDNLTLHCSTPQALYTTDFNIQDVKLQAYKIIKAPDGNKYSFRFTENDSFLCLPHRVSGIHWKDGWPIDIRGSSIHENIDTTVLKENSKAFVNFIKEKFKDGPLKKWLLENKPY